MYLIIYAFILTLFNIVGIYQHILIIFILIYSISPYFASADGVTGHVATGTPHLL
jgi:hypothetical protein